ELHRRRRRAKRFRLRLARQRSGSNGAWYRHAPARGACGGVRQPGQTYLSDHAVRRARVLTAVASCYVAAARAVTSGVAAVARTELLRLGPSLHRRAGRALGGGRGRGVHAMALAYNAAAYRVGRDRGADRLFADRAYRARAVAARPLVLVRQ